MIRSLVAHAEAGSVLRGYDGREGLNDGEEFCVYRTLLAAQKE